MLTKIKRILKKFKYLFSDDFDQDVYRNELLKARLEYLQRQVSLLHERTRYMSRLESKETFGEREQTKESFDYQWKNLPDGSDMISNMEFKKNVTQRILTFTGLDKAWFQGKRVLDAGCGQGRFTWGLLKLGAKVTAIDVSKSALKEVEQNCAEFSDRLTVHRKNLLEPLELEGKFDLVWSFGVLHHTGDTYRAFQNIAPYVQDEGYLFLMLYGEPREGMLGDYLAVNEYERLRDMTKNCSYEEKLELIRKEMREKRLMACGEEYVHGYFDAISPQINDLYRFEEIQAWLKDKGFGGISRTVDDRNHHLVAQKEASKVCAE